MNSIDVTCKVVELYFNLYAHKLIKSKGEFCAILGIHRSVFAYLERGERTVTLEQVCRAIDRLGIDAHYFFGNGKNQTNTF